MGIGDELMMAGEAKRLAAGTQRRYMMLSKYGEPKWHWAWEGNPHVARPGEHADGELPYINGRRPYIADETATQRTFREYTPEPAFLRMGEQARAFSEKTRGAIVFNPTIKDRASPNKNWGLDQWKQLVTLCPEFQWLHIGEHIPRIRGSTHIHTPNFWDACGAMAGARAVVLHEGALHHAAASLDVPTIVIRGGYISPRVTGYAGQVDMYMEDERYPLGCGMRIECEHCKYAMARITPPLVAEVLRKLLKDNKR